MFEYLRRLATTGAAYTASSILSKLLAVGLLPLYTQYLTPADYGAAEVMIAAVIATSIVIRFGVIEALMRFYYLPEEDSDEVVRTGFASLFLTATVGAAIAMAFAGPLSEALLDRPDVTLARIAIGGLWVFTLFEYLISLLRLDERARAYFVFTIANVLVAIPLTVWLVVLEGEGAKGLLLGVYGSAVPFLLWLAVDQRRRLGLFPDRELLRRLFRFGFPTMPAELSLYSLNFIDRIILVRFAGLAEAGLYALAIKFAQGINVLVRGFQLAWPPLAYSIRDDEEARRAYALIVTWFLAVCTFFVTGMWLLSRWIVRLLAAPDFFDSYEAIGLLATGITLYALYLVMVVILGRTGRTEFNFPATAAATIANIALNLALVPPLGIVGAGIALVASYLVVLVLMYAFTQRLFPVPYEWRRLALVAGSSAVLVAGGELLLPTEGAVGLLSRTAVWFVYPLVLMAAGFLHPQEREALRRMLRPSAVAEQLRKLRAAPEPAPAVAGEGGAEPTGRGPRLTEEVFEAERRDEDRGGA
jgi:O-antigen/teichoic acid export membrane protein